MKTLTYTLLPKSMLDLKAEGMPFWSTWWGEEPFAKEKAREITVEIPVAFPIETLTTTGEKALQMEGLLSASEYAQVLWLYYQATKEYLYGYYWSWTSSRSSDGHLVCLGSFDSSGARVDGGRPSSSASGLGVALSRQAIVPSVPLSSSSPLELGRLEGKIDQILSLLENDKVPGFQFDKQGRLKVTNK